MSGVPAGAGQLLGKRLGKYEILALLALGGTAEIYLARIGGAAGFEKYVVVKCLHDHLADDTEFVKMFLDEARLAAHLDHSNIVQTMELGQHDGRYYMVMEFLAGLSLAMIVRRAAERLPGNRIPVPLVLNILAQSCAGLHYAHEKAMNGKALNIVHRDISPQNLVISFEGVVKIVDFGIAKAELRETRTRSGTIKGKFAYMSPEQCVANNVDRRTDVFALGVIAHELLTGQRLFKRQSPYETYQAVIECNVKPPSTFHASIDPALDPVIMRATAKDKAERYATAEAFGDALLGYLHHRGISSGPGDVSRFFDAHFGQEIEEHSARMRELISGRDVSVDTGVTWGAGDADDEAKREAADDEAGSEAAGADESWPGQVEQSRVAGAGAPAMRDDPGGSSRLDDGDEMPAERTRIEANPLEKIDELNRLAAKTPTPRPALRPSAPKLATSGPLPLPPAPLRGPAVSAGPPGMPASGRFPELANLPTMIAEPDPDDPDDSSGDSSDGMGFLDAPTELAPGGIPPAATGLANAPTTLAPPLVPPAATSFANAPTDLVAPSVPPAATSFAHASTDHVNPPLPAFAKTQIAAPSYSAPPNGMPPPGGHAPPVQRPSVPQGYPVMNAQLSAQIATGATVFPSDHRGGPPHAAPAPQGVPPSGSYAGPRNPESGGMPGGMPEATPGAMPGAMDGYPQLPALPRGPDGGPGQDFSRNGNPIDPRALGGPPNPEQVPWGVAAASRVRAAPPWMLAVLFVGALGIALLLTIVIAKIAR